MLEANFAAVLLEGSENIASSCDVMCLDFPRLPFVLAELSTYQNSTQLAIWHSVLSSGVLIAASSLYLQYITLKINRRLADGETARKCYYLTSLLIPMSVMYKYFYSDKMWVEKLCELRRNEDQCLKVEIRYKDPLVPRKTSKNLKKIFEANFKCCVK